MFGLGATELILIAAVAFLLFGGGITKRFFSNLATGITEGRKAVKEIQDAVNEPTTRQEKSE